VRLGWASARSFRKGDRLRFIFQSQLCLFARALAYGRGFCLLAGDALRLARKKSLKGLRIGTAYVGALRRKLSPRVLLAY